MSETSIQKTGETTVIAASDGRVTLSVPIRIKRRELLCKAELRLANRPDQHVRVLRRHLDGLTDLEARGSGNLRGNAHREAVAPLLHGQVRALRHG